MFNDRGPNEPDRKSCTPEIKAIISYMDELMTEDPRYNNGAVPSQVALDLIKAGKAASFSEFESWLREMNSRVHFIAVPLDYFGEAWADKTINPFSDLDLPEYTLWAGVNGDEEAADMLRSLGISSEENSQRLLSAGIISVK